MDSTQSCLSGVSYETGLQMTLQKTMITDWPTQSQQLASPPRTLLSRLSAKQKQIEFKIPHPQAAGQREEV